MRVHIRYFAALREAVGYTTDDLDLPATATVATARAALAERYPGVAMLLPRCVAAVNRAYVTADAPLAEGDELVFVPPLGGGSPCPR
jgi:molybdopterin synthase sulfur carrier subunit